VVSFYTEGSASIELAGRYTLRAGDVLLVPAGEPHRSAAAEQHAKWALGFCPVCLIADGNEALLDPFERVRAGASAVVTIPEGRRAFLESLFGELSRETSEEREGPLIVQKSLVTLILAEVARAAAMSEDAPRVESVVTEALRFIERQCLGPLSLRDVAAAVHRSPAHLTTAVRRATGRSVQAWIIAGRLSEARRRLAHTDEVVEVIAERVGYADATHFTRIFRREHGVTPSLWRARARERRSDASNTP
jgi:AraC family transcriptional regulator, transcriptional activator of pobA